jgi:hypothetical protein
MNGFGKFAAEFLGLGEVNCVYGKHFALTGGEFAWKLANYPAPLALRHLVLANPKTFGNCHLDLRLAGAPLGFIGRASHAELARWTPAKRDAANFPVLPGFRTEE